jgi:hypothetical protein
MLCARHHSKHLTHDPTQPFYREHTSSICILQIAEIFEATCCDDGKWEWKLRMTSRFVCVWGISWMIYGLKLEKLRTEIE